MGVAGALILALALAACAHPRAHRGVAGRPPLPPPDEPKAVLPESQDEDVWWEDGFEQPGVERGRSPGQPGTVPPPESIQPPGGAEVPGRYTPELPVRPEEPK